ncbi:TIGR02587 family membrane protein [Aequorivita sp. SDUM287046]|uniref:TIGR02587 family membrane protein n=1 Tax=Aequorivita aurantiaca TaxID=3053356 RepID=A0ABT8DN52_9FLAO|nr:TIGR02587 family membrane protein [Aequorivita aurantiaca]MDN3725406.1 TIGR02587 family membrane protein [Aequorivita aurantiaca]
MEGFYKSIDQTLKEYGRGIAGGLLFSLPMLYTMELWWTGFLAAPLHLLIYLAVGIFLLMMYSHYVGLSSDTSLLACFTEALEELGLGIVVSVIILYITGRIVPEMPYSEIIGKVVVESVTVAIGISIGKAQLSDNNNSDKQEESDEEDSGKLEDLNPNQRKRYLVRSINLALCGSLIVAANVAPTEEVVLIALESAPFKLMLIAITSLAIGAAILYHINFKGSQDDILHRDSITEIIAGTAIMYALALITSAFMLWFFGRFDNLSLPGIIAETVVLGFPAILGASAGRLLIQD